jgi:hypothetical protein
MRNFAVKPSSLRRASLLSRVEVLLGRNMDSATLVLRVQPDADGNDEELAELAGRLRVQLLHLDVDSVDPVADDREAARAKGPEALVGWLAVHLGTEGIRTVIATVIGWATRTGHDVEISYGGDTLKVTGVTAAQQERVINDFLARHSPAP